MQVWPDHSNFPSSGPGMCSEERNSLKAVYIRNSIMMCTMVLKRKSTNLLIILITPIADRSLLIVQGNGYFKLVS